MMSGREKALRFAAQALGGGTLLGVWVELSEVRWYGREGLGGPALLAALSLLALLLLALGMKGLRRSRYLPALGRTATAYLSGAATGVAIGVVILLLAELLTAAVGMMMLRGFGG